MGGIGSGTWYRWDKRECLDDNISIDIRRWSREGFLTPGNWFGWQWTIDDRKTNDIQVRVKHDRVILIYRHRVRGGEWQSVEEPVYLTYTNCNYGGRRVWFQCPSCDLRAAKLYSTVPYFLCRKCCNLPYQSQGESLADRGMRKARKIRRKLDASMSMLDPIWSKPKGMHWKTFERLRRQAENAEEISWHEAAKHLPGFHL